MIWEGRGWTLIAFKLNLSQSEFWLEKYKISLGAAGWDSTHEPFLVCTGSLDLISKCGHILLLAVAVRTATGAALCIRKVELSQTVHVSWWNTILNFASSCTFSLLNSESAANSVSFSFFFLCWKCWLGEKQTPRARATVGQLPRLPWTLRSK